MSDFASVFREGRWTGSDETVCGRGSSLAYTAPLRAALAALLSGLDVKTFVDAPCGDFNWMSAVDLSGIRYIGVDVVPEVVERARRRAPQHTFLVGDVTAGPLPPADLLMTRDCLFHLPFAAIAGWAGAVLAAKPGHILVTQNGNRRNVDLMAPGGYRPLNLLAPPFSFPPPREGGTLRDYPDGDPPRHMMLWSRAEYEAFLPAAAARLRSADGPITVRWEDAPGAAHPAEANAPTERSHPFLEDVRERLENPLLLDWIVEVSLRTLWFFSRYSPRAFEYPAVLERALAAPGPVVDLGAGVSPLPFALAARGRRVLAVDNAKVVRTLASRGTWNEWGFLEYGEIDPRIRSLHGEFSAAGLAPGSVGVVTSVGVIDNMPADARRAALAAVAAALRPEGRLVATFHARPGDREAVEPGARGNSGRAGGGARVVGGCRPGDRGEWARGARGGRRAQAAGLAGGHCRPIGAALKVDRRAAAFAGAGAADGSSARIPTAQAAPKSPAGSR